MNDKPTVELSVVIATYNAESTIAKLTQQLVDLYRHRGPMQIVLVNDGSRDRTHDVCLELVERLPDIVSYLQLAKNFGEHNAVMAGLRHSLGEYVVVMDDDFQHRPEDAVRLFDEARQGRFDLVYSSFPQRQHSWPRRLGSWFNGIVANFMIDKPKDLYLSSFKCLSRRLVLEILRYRGPFPYVDGLALRCTRNVGRVEVVHEERVVGRSGYTLQKLVRLWLTVFVSFSVTPLHISTLLGFSLIVCAGVGAVYVLGEVLAGRALPSGWPFLAIITMLFAGAQLLILGLLGEYLGRLYLTINEMPQAVVQDHRGLGADPDRGTHA